MKPNRMVTCLAVAAMVAVVTVSKGWAQGGPSEEVVAPAKPRAKRVWTNDDFAPAATKPPANAPKAVEPALVPAASAVTPSPEAEQARDEVASEMLSAARLRQRAYETNLSEIRNKLQTEPSPFRREVYEKFIRDVETLSTSNQDLIKQLSREKKSGSSGGGK